MLLLQEIKSIKNDRNTLQNLQSISMRSLSLNAATINCESANNKSTDIADYITEQDIDVCCLSKTWMTENDLVTAVNYALLAMI